MWLIVFQLGWNHHLDYDVAASLQQNFSFHFSKVQSPKLLPFSWPKKGVSSNLDQHSLKIFAWDTMRFLSRVNVLFNGKRDFKSRLPFFFSERDPFWKIRKNTWFKSSEQTAGITVCWMKGTLVGILICISHTIPWDCHICLYLRLNINQM